MQYGIVTKVRLLASHNMVLLLLISVLFSFLLYKYVTRNFDHWKKRKVPFLQPSPFVGNLWRVATFKSAIGQHFRDLYNSMPDAQFFGMFVLDLPGLMIRSPELVKMIMVKDFSNFDDRTVLTDPHPVTRHLLFFGKNPEWKHNRSKLTPVFSTGKLRGMVPLMNEVGEELKKCIRRLSVSDKPIETKELCARFATDVTASCFFGINAHSFDNENAEFRAVGKMFFEFSLSTAIQQSSFFFAHQLAKLFRMHVLHDGGLTFLVNAFSGTVKNREESNYKRNDLIDIIIQMKNDGAFTEEFENVNARLMAPAIQFFLAGFETTSATIAFTLYELALHPDMQARLRNEIRDNIKKHNEIGYDSIKDMKYLDQCVAEILRKYPVLPFLDRRCNKDYQIPGTDVVIEKGTPVYIPMFGLHYDPKYFPEPEKYDPERFAGNFQERITPYSYIPFGGGPRNCIGEKFGLISTKLALIHVLSEFEVLTSKDTVSPLVFEPKCLVLTARNGIPLVFKKAL